MEHTGAFLIGFQSDYYDLVLNEQCTPHVLNSCIDPLPQPPSLLYFYLFKGISLSLDVLMLILASQSHQLITISGPLSL